MLDSVKTKYQNHQKEKALIKEVAEKNGWSFRAAKVAMQQAKENIGISFLDYSMFEFYKVPENEQPEAYKRVLKEKNSVRKVAEKTDKSFTTALKMMKEANEKIGISFLDYQRFEFFRVPIEEQAAEYEIISKNKKHFKKVAEKTGLSLAETFKKMNSANKKIGVSFSDYNRFDFYNIPEEEQEDKYKEIKHLKNISKKTRWSIADTLNAFKDAEQKTGITLEDYDRFRFYRFKDNQEAKYRAVMKDKEIILRVADRVGWTIDEAFDAMNATKRMYGLSYKDYEKYDFYEVPESKQEEISKSIKEFKEKRSVGKENCIEKTVEATGWDRATAWSKIKSVRSTCKISYDEYISNCAYLWSDEDIEEYKIQKNQDTTEKDILSIMKRTGWSYEKILEQFNEVRKRTGCTLKEYFIYRMYELTSEEQNEVFLISYSKQIRKRYDKDIVVDMMRDKEWANNTFSEYLNRSWCVNTKVTLDEFNKLFINKKIIYKPNFGSGGKGVESFHVTQDNIEQVFNYLSSCAEGNVEEYIVQNEELNKLTPKSVNTLRIVTMSSKDKPVLRDGTMFSIAYAALRIGGGKEIVDNFHSGGMVAAVDLDTGTIITDAANMDGDVFEYHPVTGTKIKGFRIPYFQEAIDMVKDAVEKFKIEGYIGWDIAIGEKGPLLVEVNTSPGADLLSTPYAKDHIGKKSVMEKYMW